MALDNETIKTGDYGKFTEAMSKVDKLNTSLSDKKTELQGLLNSLNNESIFAGPICEACVQEFTVVNTLITDLVTNFSTIQGYLSKSLTNYQNADQSAITYLSIKDNKVVESSTPASNISGYTPTTLTGNTDQDKVYNYLIGAGFSPVGAAAIIGNLHQESGCHPNNVQNGMGYSDEDYVNGIKNGTISRESFINDGRGFGIAQWTYPTRKAKLYDTLGPENIDSLDGQLQFMCNEMGEGLTNTMKSATDINSATTKFHNSYERSADKSMSARQGFAQDVYNTYNS